MNKKPLTEKYYYIVIGLAILCFGYSTSFNTPKEGGTINKMNQRIEKATLGGGCFWCLEAVLDYVRGVVKVESGYAGGNTHDPTYEEVCRGETGHAEVIQIVFNPDQISFEELLDIFWQAHDPTTLNRQGADIGTQYRSIILTHDDNQMVIAKSSKIFWDNKKVFAKNIVTEIKPLLTFYPAENYHQDYYKNNKSAGYCRLVISPKIQMLQKRDIIDKGVEDLD